MGDYPIPVDTTDDLGPIFGDISKALDLMGFRLGFMDVRLYLSNTTTTKNWPI